MNWQPLLEPGEQLCWQGRPAPRCYTFRNWRHSIFGLVLTLISAYWQSVGLTMAREYSAWYLALIPTPLLLLGLYLAFGHLLLARLAWEKVFYAVTDRRILMQKGILRVQVHDMSLSELTYVEVKPLGESLGRLRVEGAGTGTTLILSCLEHPRIVTALLEPHVRKR